ncbi:MAG: AAA family ATPase [Ignavibacteriaceae bacterium]
MEKLNAIILFIGGVFTAGKTSLSHKLSNDFGVRTLSCGKIIEKEKKIDFSEKKLLVNDIKNNQNVLIKGLAKEIKDNEKIILDGHFSLLNSDSEIEKIDKKIFESISPQLIIILTRPLTELIQKFKERYEGNIEQSLIERMQQIEIAHAQQIAKELEINCIVTSKNSYTEILHATKNIFG